MPDMKKKDCLWTTSRMYSITSDGDRFLSDDSSTISSASTSLRPGTDVPLRTEPPMIVCTT